MTMTSEQLKSVLSLFAESIESEAERLYSTHQGENVDGWVDNLQIITGCTREQVIDALPVKLEPPDSTYHERPLVAVFRWLVCTSVNIHHFGDCDAGITARIEAEANHERDVMELVGDLCKHIHISIVRDPNSSVTYLDHSNG